MRTREEIAAELTQAGRFELTIDESRGYPVKTYKNAPRSLREVYEASVPGFDDRVFLVYEGEEITFREFRRKVAALAHFLVAEGIRKGDRVAVGMRNYPEWIISFWACQAIGATVVALNAWWITSELAYALQDSTPRALILDDERRDRILPLMDNLPGVVAIVARTEHVPTGWIAFADAISGPARDLPPADIGPLDLATILYTSGTTGLPKGAMANQRNHVSNIWNLLLWTEINRIATGAEATAAAPQPGSLQTFPFFHTAGISMLSLATVTGSKVVLMYKWNVAEAIDLIEQYKLTSVGGVPIVVRQLLEAADAAGRPLSSLVGVSAGGAPVPADLVRRIESQFKGKAVAGNGYGLTETTSSVITNTGAEYFSNPDSVGRPTVTSDIRIVDDEGQDVEAGQIGEIWIRGPGVIPGYWGNPEATEAAFGGGWFRSGDLGYVGPSGLHYVVDRKKDVIIRGGENVYCAEVEAALLEHPDVRDATVLGLPHGQYGEEVGAVIQVAAGTRLADLEHRLTADLSPKLAKFKIPTAFHFTPEDLPRTATGKVLKRELRAQFRADAPAATPVAAASEI